MNLARDLIDPDADKVVRRLARRGYKAYLVGGCVRDLLLSRTPKDFDVATSATPNEIKQLFRNCRIIGRRFRLAHIFFGPKIIETSTFRANPRDQIDPDSQEELLIRRDNVFGTETDDAQRRDFTINGLFYDVETETVIDHVGGLADLEARLIRTIGEPDIRFREDPVRMLRAVKFAARLHFTIEPATAAALLRHRDEVNKCAPPRVLEEFYRMLRGGAGVASLRLLLDTGLARVLSPQLAALFGASVAPEAPPAEGAVALSSISIPLQEPELHHPLDEEESSEWAATWDEGPAEGVEGESAQPVAPPDPGQWALMSERAWRVLEQVDIFVNRGGIMSNALMLSALVHPFVVDGLLEPGVKPLDASERIMAVLRPLAAQLRVARRDAERTRQILLAQRRMMPERRRRGRPMNLVRRDYFDEALALYELAALAAGRNPGDLARWRELKSEGSGETAVGIDEAGQPAKRRRRRRGGRRRRRNGATDTAPVGEPGPPPAAELEPEPQGDRAHAAG